MYKIQEVTDGIHIYKNSDRNYPEISEDDVELIIRCIISISNSMTGSLTNSNKTWSTFDTKSIGIDISLRIIDESSIYIYEPEASFNNSNSNEDLLELINKFRVYESL